jgi:hypothetical protein
VQAKLAERISSQRDFRVFDSYAVLDKLAESRSFDVQSAVFTSVIGPGTFSKRPYSKKIIEKLTPKILEQRSANVEESRKAEEALPDTIAKRLTLAVTSGKQHDRRKAIRYVDALKGRNQSSQERGGVSGNVQGAAAAAVPALRFRGKVTR